VEFDAAFRAADFFPSWSPDLYSGYGWPMFQFYAPLSYYAAEVPVLMGVDYAGLQATVSCEVPPGDHTLEFSYRGLPQRRTGIIISIFSKAIAGCIIVLFRRIQWPAIFPLTTSVRLPESQRAMHAAEKPHKK